MKKREHRLFIRVTDEERNCILDKMYGMGIHSLSAYIRKMALDGLLPESRPSAAAAHGLFAPELQQQLESGSKTRQRKRQDLFCPTLPIYAPGWMN